jgi:hypothetical protein
MSKYKTKVSFDRVNGEKVEKGQEIELPDNEAEGYIDAGWVTRPQEKPERDLRAQSPIPLADEDDREAPREPPPPPVNPVNE